MPLHALADLSNASQVSTAGLANDAVTFAKMANLSNETKLIGRGQGAFGGDPEEITLGFGLEMTATSLAVACAEAATASTLAKRDSVGGLTCTVITAPNGASFGAVTSSGARTFSTGTTWVYGSGLAATHRTALELETISQLEAETGTATTTRAFTAERVAQAIAALGGGGGSSDRTAMTIVETDFINAGSTSNNPFLLGAAVASGTIAAVAGEANHPGIVAYSDSTSTGGGYRHFSDSSAMLIAGGETLETIFMVKSGGVRTTVTLRFGFHDAASTSAPTDGVWLEIEGDGTGATLCGKTRSNGSQTATGTTYTLTVDTWYRAKLVVNAGATAADFTVWSEAGSQLWTDDSASNLPTGAGRNLGIVMLATESTTDAAQVLCWLDWVKASINRTLTR